MNIRGYLPTSLLEWPGKIAAVVFVGGCNFRCPFCYNRDLVLNPKELVSIPEKEIFVVLEKRKKWVDGVVVTGGEPSLSSDLPRFLKKIKDLGFSAMIYTNGSKPAMLSRLLTKKLLDGVTMDVKGPLDRRYSKTAGVSVNLAEVLKSIQLILNSGIEFRFVTTVVPRLHKKKDLVDLARNLAELAQKAGKKEQSLSWTLQQFRPGSCLDEKFNNVSPYPKSFYDKILPKLRQIISHTFIRGL